MGRLRRGMPSSHVDNIYGWGTSREACNHGPCPEHTVERRRAWKAIIALEQPRQGRITSGVAYHHCPWTTHSRTMLGMEMLSSPLGTTHCRTSSGVKFHRCLLDSSNDRMTLTWQAIITFGLHTPMDDLSCGMQSSPLFSIHSWMKSSVECHHGA